MDSTGTKFSHVDIFCHQLKYTKKLHKLNKQKSFMACCILSALNFFFMAKVETYGSMEKKEKVEFILEQMRLCIAVKDYIRTQIISKKINTKFFQEEGTEVRRNRNVAFKCIPCIDLTNV